MKDIRKAIEKISHIEIFSLGGVGFHVYNLPFISMHLSPLLLFFVNFHWELVRMAVFLYFIRMLGVGCAYHRYFSHRSYEVRNRLVQFLLGVWGATSGQHGPLWWAAAHRYHHRYSDTDKDIHSPVTSSFLYSYMLWLIADRTPWISKKKDKKKIIPLRSRDIYPKDLAKYPELFYLDRFNGLPVIFLGIGVWALYSWAGVVWYAISTLVLYHGSSSLTSFLHLYGQRRFDTADASRNNFLVSLITLGEGWHNNHHYYPKSAKSGLCWYEFDLVYWFLWFLYKLKIVTSMELPPPSLMQKATYKK